MRYGSICSGIEAASAAWKPLGWEPIFVSEIEPFAREVLKYHHPSVPLHGDFTTIKEGEYGPIDLLVGGTPCQSFSIAGLRGGMADERGNLALEYLRLADRLRPRWLVWENVPGVLSSGGGRDFGSFLGGLAKLGYGFAYRVLDAQFFGLAQRRKRVFVVGYLGDWRRAAAVLFEPASLRWDTPPSRKAGEKPARCLANGTGSVGGQRYDGESEDFVVSPSLRAKANDSHRADSMAYVAAPLGSKKDGGWRGDLDNDTYVTHSVDLQNVALGGDVAGTLDTTRPTRGGGQAVLARVYAIQERPVSENPDAGPDGAGFREDVAYTLEARQQVQAVSFQASQSGVRLGETLGTLDANYGSRRHNGVLSFHENQRAEITLNDTAGSLKVGGGKPGQGYPAAMCGSAVRRLTPRECERLQGFPDDYTLISYRGRPAADGPRYRALGNSMAVPVMARIGQRIEQQEEVSGT